MWRAGTPTGCGETGIETVSPVLSGSVFPTDPLIVMSIVSFDQSNPVAMVMLRAVMGVATDPGGTL